MPHNQGYLAETITNNFTTVWKEWLYFSSQGLLESLFTDAQLTFSLCSCHSDIHLWNRLMFFYFQNLNVMSCNKTVKVSCDLPKLAAMLGMLQFDSKLVFREREHADCSSSQYKIQKHSFSLLCVPAANPAHNCHSSNFFNIYADEVPTDLTFTNR